MTALAALWSQGAPNAQVMGRIRELEREAKSAPVRQRRRMREVAQELRTVLVERALAFAHSDSEREAS